MRPTTLGLVLLAMLLGCAAGAFFAGRLADRMGRRFIMRIAAVGFIIMFTIPLGLVGSAAGLLLTHTTISVVVLIGLGATAVVGTHMRKTFLPDRNQGDFSVHLELPAGTPVASRSPVVPVRTASLQQLVLVLELLFHSVDQPFPAFVLNHAAELAFVVLH